MNENLNFTVRPAGEATLIAASGRIDSSTSPDFEEQVGAVLDKGPRALIIDLTGVNYMSSAGLRVLLLAAKRTKADGSRLILCGLSPHIQEVFDVSGFSAIFDIVPDASEAERRAGS